ncbi:liver carboxylesterase 1 isoform X3 [Heterocephalus glaber]|uniref:Carboxylic ester hydrolase n=1 Tax=Heterocephalus glaber TaxID=10181 RepID=A0AAX6T7X5_HETGA|nr:liver carboxylesterase 1 isoform X3 [Heterocephalus glaber]
MMQLYALVLVSFTACTVWAGHTSSPPVVDTVHGKVLGKYVSLEGVAQPVSVFLGVPFAKPPLGSLRFAPPQPPERWNYVKNTTSYPPMCSQNAEKNQLFYDLFTSTQESISLRYSEDCLYLNIYTPVDLRKKSSLPVMVWIHGGGLTFGGASTYNGLALSAHENVIVVTIQYRLGIWGFFSTGDEHSRGNWGHLDQVAALHWVQDNIAGFGGNPGSVTIFGGSAGGESISILVLSPLTKNLFHRAISESGVAISGGLVRKDIKPLAEKIAVAAGCKTITSAIMVHCLRQKTEEELLEITHKIKLLSIDLLGDPKELWGNPIPEDKLDQKTATSLLRRFSPFLNVPEELTSEATERYLGGTDDPVKKRELFLDLLTDLLFGVPSVIVARGHRDARAPTYMYEFQYHPSFSSDLKPKAVKGDHGDEIFSVFGVPFLKEGASEEEINLSKMVMQFWANFARNGNPNGEGLPHWPEYDHKEEYLQIGVNTQPAQRLKDKEVTFWTQLLAREAVEKPPQKEHTEL